MNNVDNKIKNIYYMLCYTYENEKLVSKEKANLGSEAFDNIYDFFSFLLCRELKKRVKKGINKDYNNIIDEINVIKGKININETINNRSLIKKRVVCEFDEYGENILLNQIIKTTIYYLIKSNKIEKKRKNPLNEIYMFFANVDILDIKTIRWERIRFNRNNISYKFIVYICKLILNGLIVSDKKGENKFADFLDDITLSAIYEKFILKYYKKHYPELKAKSENLYLTRENKHNLIPIMRTDITLEYNKRKLIIDAKFYGEILANSHRGEHKIIRNNHLYQILAYVDNQDPYKKGDVYGMLLYAQTVNEPTISIVQTLNMHKIIIDTLDMNKDWFSIKSKLNSIADSFKDDAI